MKIVLHFFYLVFIVFVLKIVKADFTFEIKSLQDVDTDNDKITLHLCNKDQEFHSFQIPCELRMYKKYRGKPFKVLVEQNGRKQKYDNIQSIRHQFYMFPDALLIVPQFDGFMFPLDKDFSQLRNHNRTLQSLKLQLQQIGNKIQYQETAAQIKQDILEQQSYIKQKHEKIMELYKSSGFQEMFEKTVTTRCNVIGSPNSEFYQMTIQFSHVLKFK